MEDIQLESELTCPECGHRVMETMPTDHCLYYYKCKQCGALFNPKPGDCCVFCSFGSVPCPPIQKDSLGQGGGGCCG